MFWKKEDQQLRCVSLSVGCPTYIHAKFHNQPFITVCQRQSEKHFGCRKQYAVSNEIIGSANVKVAPLLSKYVERWMVVVIKNTRCKHKLCPVLDNFFLSQV